jgi:hypothetical protein
MRIPECADDLLSNLPEMGGFRLADWRAEGIKIEAMMVVGKFWWAG